MSVQFHTQPDTADPIDNLPTDQTVPTHNEIQIVDSLFKEKLSTVQKILEHTKDVLLVGFLFIILSLTQVDDMIKKFIPTTATSPYILLMLKAIVFMVVYFVLKNLYLVRKNK